MVVGQCRISWWPVRTVTSVVVVLDLRMAQWHVVLVFGGDKEWRIRQGLQQFFAV